MRLLGAAVLAPALFVSLAALPDQVSAAPASVSAAAPASRVIVVLKPSVGDPASVSKRQSSRLGLSVDAVYTHALRGYAASVDTSKIATLKADPSVADVVPDEEFRGATTPGCPICDIPQVTTRGVRRIGANLSSTTSGDGAGSVNVNIAVLDTGIQVDHPDLNVVGGKGCLNGSSFGDVEGHGTIVAGVIGAKDNAIGIVGVAPGARLWAVQVTNKKNAGSTRSVLCGIDWVTGTRTDADPTNDIQVANMSLGGPLKNANTGKPDDENCGIAQHDVVHEAICASTAAGVTYVAAAGNSGIDFARFSPASYSEVLATTAITDGDGVPGGLTPDPCGGFADDTAAPFSNFATLPADTVHTVAAPGVCISSTYPGSDVAVDSGTSYAAPLVTGTVALCVASGACSGLTPAQIVTKIVADASAYAVANPGAGFAGDPQHPQAGKFYGPLIRAALY